MRLDEILGFGKKPQHDDEWTTAAKANVERNWEECKGDPEKIYQCAYDGAMDQGAAPAHAEMIADRIAQDVQTMMQAPDEDPYDAYPKW